MSSIVSRRPSSRNHLNEAIWMSIRCGSSSTCSRRENDLRGRGEATFVVKKEPPLGTCEISGIRACRNADERNVGATRQHTEGPPFTASEARGRLPVGRATIARLPPGVQRAVRAGQNAAGRLAAPSESPFVAGGLRRRAGGRRRGSRRRRGGRRCRGGRGCR